MLSSILHSLSADCLGLDSCLLSIVSGGGLTMFWEMPAQFENWREQNNYKIHNILGTRRRRKGVSRETWSRFFLFSVIRELWMIGRVVIRESRKLFFVNRETWPEICTFFHENGPAVQKSLQKNFWGCSQIAWVKYVTDLTEININNDWWPF